MTGIRPAIPLPTGLALCALLAIVIPYPLIVTSNYGIGTGITVGTMAICAVGYVLLIGFGEQLALGQTAFCMVGGYGSAILVTRYGLDSFGAMVIAMCAAMGVAYIVGLPILKLRGYILAMASIALLLLFVYVAQAAVGLTGGAMGLSGIPRFSVLGWQFADDRTYYYFVWSIVVLSVLFGLNIDRSRIGRSLKAIAVSEDAAGSVGIDIVRHKVQMFVASAGLASLTGSLTVHYLGIVEPSVFDFTFALSLLTAAVIGGLTSIWGGVIGACLIVLLREAVRFAALPLLDNLFMGLLTVLVLILLPGGMVGALRALYGRLCSNFEARAALPRPAKAADPTGSATIAARRVTAVPQSDDGPLLRVDGVSRAFGSLVAVDNVSFAVERHSITALIGPNGAGKTTMFNMISGHQPVGSGHILFEGRRIEKDLPQTVAARGIARTFQNLQLFDTMSVIENVMCGGARKSYAGLLLTAARLPAALAEERALRAAAERSLAAVGLQDFADWSPGALPFGHQRLLEIARALALEPTLLLMDEPASGLNDTETELLAGLILRIRSAGTTILLIEHDIRLVMGLAEHVVVMSHGEKIAEGPPDLVRKDPRVIEAYLGT